MPQAWKRYPILAEFVFMATLQASIHLRNTFPCYRLCRQNSHFYKELAKRKNSFPEYIKT